MRENKINLDEYKENYPNSQKSYKKIYDLDVPYRAITISDTSGDNRIFHVYDTTGPYTDPNYKINLQAGLPKKRDEWILDQASSAHKGNQDGFCRFKK